MQDSLTDFTVLEYKYQDVLEHSDVILQNA